jgi:hypothetical protein
VPIPAFNDEGQLPPGEHQATLDEIAFRFGRSSVRRSQLQEGLHNAVTNFKAAGIQRIWINGSFTSDKVEPNDIDGCWEYHSNVDLSILDPVFLMESRIGMKRKFGLDFFLADWIEGSTGIPFPHFFQVDRNGHAKGIIVLEINHDHQ